MWSCGCFYYFFFFQAEDGIRDHCVTGVQTCALPISVGLGWTLDVGGLILRDTKGTLATSDDAFTLLFGGVKYDLVLIDATQNIYHTRDDIFVKVEYVAASDYWLLTAKDGTRYRFGGSAASQAIGLSADLVTPVTTKYLLDQVTTPSSVAIQYSYAKYTATASNGRTYD